MAVIFKDIRQAFVVFRPRNHFEKIYWISQGGRKQSLVWAQMTRNKSNATALAKNVLFSASTLIA